MKKVYLIRHAKSSWKDVEMRDIDRPLNNRGVKNAYQMVERLKSQSKFPEVMLCSPATRAIHTAIIFARNFEYPLQRIGIRNEFYDASYKNLLDALAKLNHQYNSVMLFGHNPSMENLINSMLDERVEKFPTCAIAEISFNIEQWSEVNDVKGNLEYFDYPKRKNE